MMLYLISLMGSPTYSSSGENDGPPVQLTGDDVTEYDQSDGVPLINPVRRIVQGEKLENGCGFSGYIELERGQRYILTRTQAVNWETCEALEEEGTVSAEDGEAMMVNEDDATGEATP